MTDTNCPACGCPDDIWLGQLAQRVHVRCRDCGMDYSYLVDAEDENENEDDCDDDGRFDTDAEADEDVIEPDGQPDEAQEWHDFDPDC